MRRHGEPFLIVAVPDRHPELDVPAAWWFLSTEGRGLARLLAGLRLWQPVERLYTGPGVAQHEAAQIIASCNGIGVTVLELLNQGDPVPPAANLLRQLARRDGARGGAVVARTVIEDLTHEHALAAPALVYGLNREGVVRALITDVAALAHMSRLGNE